MRLRFGGILPRIACFRISIRFYNNHFPIERSASHSATSPIAYSAIRPAEDFFTVFAVSVCDSVRRSRTDCAVFSCSSFLLTEVLCLIPRTRVTRLIPAGIRRIVSGTVSRPFKTYSVRTISQFSQSSVSCSATLSFSDRTVGQHAVFLRPDMGQGDQRVALVAQRLPVVRLQVPACPAAAPCDRRRQQYRQTAFKKGTDAAHRESAISVLLGIRRR